MGREAVQWITRESLDFFMVAAALQVKGKTGSFQYMGLEPLGSTWRKMKLLSPFTLHYASGLIIYIWKAEMQNYWKEKGDNPYDLGERKKQKA